MRGLKIVLMSFCLTGLVACAQPGAIDEINDPHEEQNRKTHELNKAVDQAETRFRILQTIWACLRMF